MKSRKRKEEIITGIVVPEDRDGNDRVIGVALKASDHEQYVVEYNRQCKGLLSLINQKVRVRGKLRERLNGDIIITVEHFERIDEGEERQYVSKGVVG